MTFMIFDDKGRIRVITNNWSVARQMLDLLSCSCKPVLKIFEEASA